MMYHDMKYNTPGQMHDNNQFTSPHDHSMYQSPSIGASGLHNVDEIDLNSYVHYNGTIDPSSL